MKTNVAPLLVASLLLPMLGAQQKSEPAGDRVARVAAVKQEFQAAQQAAIERYQKAKDDAERQRIAESMHKQAPYAKKLWPLVDELAGDEAAAQALAWIAGETEDKVERAKAANLLLQHHVGNPVIAEVLMSMVYVPSEAGRQFLERVAKDAPLADVRAKAIYAQAQLCNRIVDLLDRLQDKDGDPQEQKQLRERIDAELLAWLETQDRAAMAAKREALYEKVVAEHASVAMYDDTLGALAKAELRELRDLAIGKVAPDIVGKDADGVEFKLSDYRGKVVVLDFWGEW